MRTFYIHLFGNVSVSRDSEAPLSTHPGKIWELFCYIALFHQRVHHRESLAGLFWGDKPDAEAKKYLRQALWQLQTTLGDSDVEESGRILQITPEWVRLNPNAIIEIDVVNFGHAYEAVRGIHGESIKETHARILQEAIALYRGDLMEGYTPDWCLYERVCLRDMHLSMLYKLMCYHARQGQYEAGIACGERILRLERAHERTHRLMMGLRYLIGDRTGALLQSARCRDALHEELRVQPMRLTEYIHDCIRNDLFTSDMLFLSIMPETDAATPDTTAEANQARYLLHYIREMEMLLGNLQSQLRQYLRMVE